MASTSYGWTLAEWGTWRAGGVVVPIYETSPRERIEALVERVGARFVFVDEAASARIPSPWPGAQVVPLPAGRELATSFGVTPTREEIAELDAIEVGRDDVATIVSTSGTNAEPQATVLVHRNFVDLVLNVQAAWRTVLNEGGRTVIILPLSHVLARGLQTICLWAGMRVTYLSNPRELVASLPALAPTFLVVVPRVLEKVTEAVRSRAASRGLGRVWEHAEETAVQWGRLCEEADRRGTTPEKLASWRLRVGHRVFDRLFYRKVAALLGGSMEFMLSGRRPSTSGSLCCSGAWACR